MQIRYFNYKALCLLPGIFLSNPLSATEVPKPLETLEMLETLETLDQHVPTEEERRQKEQEIRELMRKVDEKNMQRFIQKNPSDLIEQEKQRVETVNSRFYKRRKKEQEEKYKKIEKEQKEQKEKESNKTKKTKPKKLVNLV